MVEAVALHRLSGGIQRRTLPWAAYGFSLLIIVGLLESLLDFGVGPAVFNHPALLDLAIKGLLPGASFIFPANTPAWLNIAYRLMAHLTMRIWLWREFSFLPDGHLPFLARLAGTGELNSWALLGIRVRSRMTDRSQFKRHRNAQQRF